MTASIATTTIDSQARRWLRLEGLAVLVAAGVAFGRLGGEFLWFLPALLVPDLAIAGYLGGPRIGAFVYNLVHNWAFGLAVLGCGPGVSASRRLPSPGPSSSPTPAWTEPPATA